MDFFGAIAAHSRSCKVLFALFLLAISLFAGIAAIALGWGVAQFALANEWQVIAYVALQPTTLIITAVVISCLLALATFFRYLDHSTNIESLVISLGARLLNDRQPQEQAYQNVVEEIAIAAGIPAPIAVVLPHEQSINAFAIVSQHGEAIIGVTHGALSNLERAELQAVVAHEVAHILGNDGRENLLLLSMISGIELLFHVGAYICDLGSGSSLVTAKPTTCALREHSNTFDGKPTGPLPIKPAIVLIGLPLCVVGLLGLFCSTILRLGISRQREFLADAEAVRLTRDPHSLAAALNKINSLSLAGEIRRPGAALLNHFFFVTTTRRFFARLFTTHPPLSTRISVLNSGMPSLPVKPHISTADSEEQIEAGQQLRPHAFDLPHAADISAPEELINLVLQPHFANLGAVTVLLASIPQWLRSACHSCESAQQVLLALFVAEQYQNTTQNSAEQLQASAFDIVDHLQSSAPKMLPAVTQLPLICRLPLLDCASMSLLMLPEDRRENFLQILERVVSDDSSAFSTGLYLLLESRLRSQQSDQRFSAEDEHQAFATTLYHFFTLSGPTEDRSLIAQSIKLASSALGTIDERTVANADPSTRAFIQALRTLQASAPETKAHLLRALCIGMTADDTISVLEVELLRAVAGQLGTQVPPFHDLLTDMHRTRATTNASPLSEPRVE